MMSFFVGSMNDFVFVAVVFVDVFAHIRYDLARFLLNVQDFKACLFWKN